MEVAREAYPAGLAEANSCYVRGGGQVAGT